VDKIVEGKGKLKLLLQELRNSMHEFVLDDSSHIEPYHR